MERPWQRTPSERQADPGSFLDLRCDIGATGDDTVYDSVSTISTDGGGDHSVAVEVDETPQG